MVAVQSRFYNLVYNLVYNLAHSVNFDAFKALKIALTKMTPFPLETSRLMIQRVAEI